ncbi:hypothetical protein RJ639_017513 [Escallonia herrerae]|uniref:RNase H type-1 domain-containing protein n=1 Tax=Escallonia herrerae TaxID=1293975 RepID=A0AA88VFP8_9ASTE|nr:hypothetical protein RJ639_017513 [Escallonia herrerae]
MRVDVGKGLREQRDGRQSVVEGGGAVGNKYVARQRGLPSDYTKTPLVQLNSHSSALITCPSKSKELETDAHELHVKARQNFWESSSYQSQNVRRNQGESMQRDVFAWTYKEMLGLDPKVAVHHLAVKSGVRPVKQAQRMFHLKVVLEIEVEINKLIEVGFIREPWMMFFDGAARSDGAGAGVVFVSLQPQVLPYAFTLGKKCSNNVAENQALIIGLQMALELGIPSVVVSGDSKLVINQLLKEYKVKKEDLVPYFLYATILINKFNSVELEHVPKEENRMANALANLATTLALRGEDKVDIPVCQQWVLP